MSGKQPSSFLEHFAYETYSIVFSVVMTMEKVLVNAADIAHSVWFKNILRLTFIQIMYRILVPSSPREQSVSINTPVGVDVDHHTKHINALCGNTRSFFIVAVSGTFILYLTCL